MISRSLIGAVRALDEAPRIIEGVGGIVGPFLQDNFAGTAATHLENHTPDIGGAWSIVSLGLTNLEIDLNGSGKAITQLQAAVGSSMYINAVTPPTADYKVVATFTVGDFTGTDDFFLFARAGSNPNTQSYNFGYVKSAQEWQLRRNTTRLAGTNVILVQGQVVQIEMRIRGTTLTGYADGVQQLTTTDATYASAGQVAIYGGGSGAGSGGKTGHAIASLSATVV